jgi:hypothetical protein
MMNLASFIVAFFLICLIIAVPPFGILVLIFYVIWWIFDSGKNDQCQTTEVTIITEIPSNTLVVTTDQNGYISNVEPFESVEFVRDEEGKKWEHSEHF